MSTTIYDVADRAGVSISTVSRVINSPQAVTPETRQRVLEAIDSLAFIPKSDAAERARKKTNRIGVLAPFFTAPSFVQRLRGIAKILTGVDYELVVYNNDSAAYLHNYLFALPMARRIDGLIVISLQVDDAMVGRLHSHKLQTVLIETAHPKLTGVEIDNESGGWLAAEYLIGKGHQRLAFVGGDSEIPGYTLPTSRLRLNGYRQAILSAGLSLPAEFVQMGTPALESGAELGYRLLEKVPRPTAIFAASDMLALGVLKSVARCGLRCPQDVAVMGFDDLDIAEYMGLTTITQALDESGRVAVELLLARIAEPERTVQHVRLPLRIVERQSA